MARILPGGTNPFQTGLRPSAFNSLPVQETIERLGEPVIWLREMPTPYVRPGRLTLPDQPADGKGYYHTVPNEIQVEQEVSIPYWRSARRVYTKQGPIAEILRARVFRRADYGGGYDLEIGETGDNWFEYKNEPVPDYEKILIDYKIKTTRELTVEFEQSQAGRRLELAEHPELVTDTDGTFVNVIVAVRSLRRFTGPDTLEELADFTHDFTRIYPARTYPAGTRFRIELTVYDTMPVAYRTMDARDAQAKNIKIQGGDLELVTSPYMRLAEGDLIIFTRTQKTAKETIHRTGEFRLSRHPVRSIESCLALDARGQTIPVDPNEIRIEGFNRLILSENIESAAVVYNHHPQYRVQAHVETAGLAGRLQPPIWHLIPDQTGIVFK